MTAKCKCGQPLRATPAWYEPGWWCNFEIPREGAVWQVDGPPWGQYPQTCGERAEVCCTDSASLFNGQCSEGFGLCFQHLVAHVRGGG